MTKHDMLLYKTPPDGGMPYLETNLEHLFPEPLNALTSCFFLVIAIYWTVKLRGQWSSHIFLTIALGLLYIGGIGGTIYHGLRQWSVFIMMDWLPIMLLCVAAGVYFLGKLTRRYFAVLLVIGYGFFQYYLRRSMSDSGDIQLFININYGVMASLVLFPVLGYLIKTRFTNGRWVAVALAAFVAALTFRVIDKWGAEGIGTHFLWHTFGAVAAFCMFQYIYLINVKTPDAL